MKGNKQIEAFDIVILSINEVNTRGTDDHANAKRLHDEAVKQWKEQLENRNKCPHCGKSILK